MKISKLLKILKLIWKLGVDLYEEAEKVLEAAEDIAEDLEELADDIEEIVSEAETLNE